MAGYTFVAPRSELPETWLAELRAFVASREDVRGLYWVTALHEDHGTTSAQDELHIELVDPPQESADREQYRMFSEVFPTRRDGGSSVWCISPVHILAEIRDVALRVP